VINVIAVFLIQLQAASHPTRVMVLSGLLILLNVVGPIVLAFSRGYIALGILVAFASAFALTVIEGVFFTISDFAGAINNSSIGFGFLAVGFILFAIGAFFVLRRIHRGIK
jgi:hypothetical protein